VQRVKFFKRTTCVCGHCGEVFEYQDARSSPRKLYNVEINEKVCPHCGRLGFTRFTQQPWLDRFISDLKA